MIQIFDRMRCAGVGLVCALMMVACGREREEHRTEDVVATYRGGYIAKSDLPREALYNAEYKVYRLKSNRVRSAIQKAYLAQLAQQEGVSVEAFIQRHIAPRIAVTEAEVERRRVRAVHAFKQRNPYGYERLSEAQREVRLLGYLRIEPDGEHEADDLLAERVQDRIFKLKEQEEVRRFVREAGLKLYLPELEPPHYEIATQGHPSLGPEDAPVTLVTFSDFQCQYSRQAAPELKKLIEAFPGQVRLVFRHYPLPVHADAQGAAEAAVFAFEQGKFWEYHDVLFANQEYLTLDDLVEYAVRIGLNGEALRERLQSRAYEAQVRADVAAGMQYSIVMTPAFYLNGRPHRQTTTDYFEELYGPVQKVLGKGEEIRPSAEGVLAEVGGVRVLEADVAHGRLRELEDQVYQAVWDETKKLLEERLVALAARERGMAVAAYYQREIFTAPLPEEVDAQYDLLLRYVAGNPRLMHLEPGAREREILRLLNVASDEAGDFERLMRERLAEVIRAQKLEQGRPMLLSRLMQRFEAEIHVKPPEPPVYELATEGHPALGPEGAPVTIVAFSDFQCPYSRQIAAVLYQVLARYPERVRVVFRNFPIERHKEAQKAHEAAACAADQDEFWAYHDLLYARQDALDVESLKQYAAEAGLNVGQFNQCLNTGRYADHVKRDMDDAATYDVRGTPSVYINGRPRNIRSFEQFAYYITDGKEGVPTTSQSLISSMASCH